MAYSEAVLDHYENPRNVGVFDKDDTSVGTGMVGAPACGDVMRLQIKVNDEGVIEDAKFKTYGCLVSNSQIATPVGYQNVSDLNVGDEVFAWDGEKIVVNKVANVDISEVHYSDLLRMKIDKGGNRRQTDETVDTTIICTKDHIWWAADNRPVEAQDLTAGMELLHMTENELRSLRNVGKQEWMRKLASETMRKTNAEGKIDRTKMPQHQKGYQAKDPEARRLNSSKATKQLWADPEYVKKWQKGMEGASQIRPTRLEQDFINIFDENEVDVRYVGNGDFWVNTPEGNHLNPDFKVNGQRKVIEVYTRSLPSFMMDRESPNWMIQRKRQFASANLDCMFIEHSELNKCMSDVQRFIHNGIKITSISPVSDKRQLRGLERNDEMVKVYDMRLCEGANIYFVDRVMSHNCGSAIASSSLLTEWVKGKTLEEATAIKNTEIAEELALPPVKIHCSVLAESAVKSAIADYQKKQEKTA